MLASLPQQRTASPVPDSGDHSAVEPPVPIPNTEVKRCSPNGSATIGRARVGHRQNKNPDEFISSGFLPSGRRRLERDSGDSCVVAREYGQAREGSGRLSREAKESIGRQ